MGREDLAREALTRKSGADRADRPTSRRSTPSSRARRRSSRSPRSGCRPRSTRSAPARRRSRRPTRPPRRRPASTRPSPGSPRRWATSGMAVQRAEDKTAQMQARAGAIDELIASGALDDASSINRGDDISRELESMSSESDVEAELAALKGNAPAGDRRAGGARPGPGADGDPRARGRAARRASSHDRPHPRRGSARGGRRASWSTSTQLDGAVESAVESGDTEAFAAALTALLDGVRRAGTPLADDSLEDSDLILPPADAHASTRSANCSVTTDSSRAETPGDHHTFSVHGPHPLRPRHRTHRADDRGAVPARRRSSWRSSSA